MVVKLMLFFQKQNSRYANYVAIYNETLKCCLWESHHNPQDNNIKLLTNKSLQAVSHEYTSQKLTLKYVTVTDKSTSTDGIWTMDHQFECPTELTGNFQQEHFISTLLLTPPPPPTHTHTLKWSSVLGHR